MSQQFKGEIQVLLSDFQMAGMSGIDLATAITVDRPKLKVLLMSGFPSGLLVLNDGWHFLSNRSWLRNCARLLKHLPTRTKYPGSRILNGPNLAM